MQDAFIRKLACTLYVIAGFLTLQLIFGRRPLRVASIAVGVLYLIAAAAFAFWPTLRVRSRAAGIALVILAAVIVSEAAAGFMSLRFALDGSLPWSNWFRSATFTAGVELLNITFIVGVGWAVGFLAERIARKRQA